MNSLSRREAMRLGLLGGGLLTLAACTGPLVTEPLVTVPLVTEPPKALQIEQRGIYIDVHTHIFNADDLSVEGFLSNVIGNQVAEHVDPKYVQRISRVLDRIVQRMARDHVRENKLLERLLGEVEGLAPDQKSQALRELDKTLPSEGEFRRELEEALEEAIFEELGLGDQTKLQRELSPYIKKFAEKLKLGERLGRTELGKEIKGFFLSGRLKPVFEFAFRMVWYRYKNAQSLFKHYGQGEDGIDLFVPALVDMQYWLSGDPPKTGIRDQIKLMEKIVRLTNGRILPFAPFDPWREIDEEGAALDLVDWAVKKMGFAGVKIYPPMGFRPLGNVLLTEAKDWPPHARERPDISEFGAKIDEAMRKLYGWCVENDVPIMAHGNNSIEAGQKYGERAAPRWWAQVYNFPGNGGRLYKNLKVNLGHFGGWHSLIGRRGWPWEIGKLMQRNPGLFADLSSFNKIHSAENRGKLVEALTAFHGDFSAASSRLLYGSDWLMNAYAKNSDKYQQNFVGLYRERLPRLQHRFFGHNAVEFLGLRKGNGNRTRLDNYYDSRGLKPAWRERLDSSA